MTEHNLQVLQNLQTGKYHGACDTCDWVGPFGRDTEREAALDAAVHSDPFVAFERG